MLAQTSQQWFEVFTGPFALLAALLLVIYTGSGQRRRWMFVRDHEAQLSASEKAREECERNRIETLAATKAAAEAALEAARANAVDVRTECERQRDEKAREADRWRDMALQGTALAASVVTQSPPASAS